MTLQTKKPAYHHGDLRKALLEAGEAELSESGLAGFSLRRVAARAGVSHSAPAHHFGDLAGLIDALAARGFALLLSLMEHRQKSAASDPHERLICSGLGYLDFAVAHPALFRLVFGTPMQDGASDDLCAAAGQSYAHLAAAVAALPNASPDDASLRAEVLGYWSQAHGFAELLLSGHIDKIDLTEANRPAREALFRQMFQPKSHRALPRR